MNGKLLSAEEFRGMDAARQREVEVELRKELADTAMDIYTPRTQHVGKIRAAKRNLARVLTVRAEAKKQKKNA